MLRVEAINADRDQLGEGPLWDVEEQALYWIDSFMPAVFRLDPRGGRRRWALRSGSARSRCGAEAGPSARFDPVFTRSISPRGR